MQQMSSPDNETLLHFKQNKTCTRIVKSFSEKNQDTSKAEYSSKKRSLGEKSRVNSSSKLKRASVEAKESIDTIEINQWQPSVSSTYTTSKIHLQRNANPSNYRSIPHTVNINSSKDSRQLKYNSTPTSTYTTSHIIHSKPSSHTLRRIDTKDNIFNTLDCEKKVLENIAADIEKVLVDSKISKEMFATIHLDGKILNSSYLNIGMFPSISKASLLKFIDSYINKGILEKENKDNFQQIRSAILFGSKVDYMTLNIHKESLTKHFSGEDIPSRYSPLTHKLIDTPTITIKEQLYHAAFCVLGKITNLQMNEFITINARSIEGDSQIAHSTLLEIRRTGSFSYDIILYDTDKESSKAYRKTNFPNGKVSTAFKIADISLSKISNMGVWKSILELNMRNYFDPNEQNSPYKILSSLGDFEEIKVGKTPQKSNICSWDCLIHFLKNNLDKVEYRKFELYMLEESITEFGKFVNLGNSIEEIQKRIANKKKSLIQKETVVRWINSINIFNIDFIKVEAVDMISMAMERLEKKQKSMEKLGFDGLEPSTPSLKVRCSNQLS